PKLILFPEAQGAELPEGNNDPCENWARRGTSPAGCSTMARMKRTAQAPGRPSPLLDTFRLRGEPVSCLRRTTRLQAHVGSRPILVTSGEVWYLPYFYAEETRTAIP